MCTIDKKQDVAEMMNTFSVAITKLKSVMEIEYVRRPYILAFKTIEAKYRMILQEIHRYDSSNMQYPESLKKEIVHYLHTIEKLREEVGITVKK